MIMFSYSGAEKLEVFSHYSCHSCQTQTQGQSSNWGVFYSIGAL